MISLEMGRRDITIFSEELVAGLENKAASGCGGLFAEHRCILQQGEDASRHPENHHNENAPGHSCM